MVEEPLERGARTNRSPRHAVNANLLFGWRKSPDVPVPFDP